MFMYMKNELLKNRYLYKVAAIVIKYLPSALSLWQIMMLCLNFAGISVPILGFIGGTSIMFLGLLYLVSYLFQYCYLYRIPLGYNLTINIIVLLRSSGLLPIELLMLYRAFMIITGIFIAIFVFFMYKNRNNPKVGGIKSFCEKYCDC